MAITNLSKWKWNILSNKNGPFVSVDNDTNLSMPRICDIDMVKGIVTIEERFLKDVDEEGDLYTLSLHLASEDALNWIAIQLMERARSMY